MGQRWLKGTLSFQGVGLELGLIELPGHSIVGIVLQSSKIREDIYIRPCRQKAQRLAIAMNGRSFAKTNDVEG